MNTSTTIDPNPTPETPNQPELTRHQKQDILTRISEILHSKGASQPTIDKALHAILHPTPNTTPPGLNLSTIQTHPIQWLWQQRLPLGKLTLLAGESGVGTSLFALTLAASVSAGIPMPGQPTDPTSSNTPIAQGPVIIIAPQTSAADTLIPRLQAAGGDPSHILLLNTIESLDPHAIHTPTLYDRPFSLPQDLNILEDTITRTQALLVIIDPLALILHRSNHHPIQETLIRLAHLAERTNCAILLIHHLRPGHASRLSNQDAGFPGLIASATTVLRLIQHPDHPNQRILITAKRTLTFTSATLAFQITEPTPGIPTFHCLGETPYPLKADQTELSTQSVQRQSIHAALNGSFTPLTPTEIARRTGQPYDSTRLLLSRMADAGEIAHPMRGYYSAWQSRPQPHHQPPTSLPPDTSDTKAADESLSYHCKGGGGVDEGWRPLRSPSGGLHAAATLDESPSFHCRGGGEVDEGPGPLRSPSGGLHAAATPDIPPSYHSKGEADEGLGPLRSPSDVVHAPTTPDTSDTTTPDNPVHPSVGAGAGLTRGGDACVALAGSLTTPDTSDTTPTNIPPSDQCRGEGRVDAGLGPLRSPSGSLGTPSGLSDPDTSDTLIPVPDPTADPVSYHDNDRGSVLP